MVVQLRTTDRLTHRTLRQQQKYDTRAPILIHVAAHTSAVQCHTTRPRRRVVLSISSPVDNTNIIFGLIL